VSSIRLLIADDHRLFRRGLRQACEIEEGCEVVGEAENGQEAVELARRLQPDVILMDIEMPVMGGVQATGFIAAENPEARVVVLTVYQKDEYVFEAIKAGARGYLLKGVDEETLIETIRAVHRGDVLIDSHVASRVLEEFRRLSLSDAQARLAEEEERIKERGRLAEIEMELLTEGEMEVLHLVAQGEDNKTISRQLSLSEKTITNRLSAIYQKLQVNNRTQAALHALRRGWVKLDPEE
jgi:NarL family two-component system response regulator LiaR